MSESQTALIFSLKFANINFPRVRQRNRMEKFVFFHVIVYIVTRYMYDVVRRDFALSASFVLECFDGSEVTTREGNELVLHKENCVVEEIKGVELRSRRGKLFITELTIPLV